jgi:hypothetical protein
MAQTPVAVPLASEANEMFNADRDGVAPAVVSLGGANVSPTQMLPIAFSLFGGTAGLFAIFALGAFREPARSVWPIAPLLATSVIGFLAGKVLARLQWPKGFDVPFEVTLVRVGATAVLAGAASGAAVAFATWGLAGVPRFALGGAAVGLMLYPGCHAVFRAAVNAARARHGSLVAEADQRTVASTLLAGAALLATTQIPALLMVTPSSHVAPLWQAACSLCVSVVAAGAIWRMQQQDATLQTSLTEALQGEAWFEPLAEPKSIAHDAVDLGIGDEHLALGQNGGYRAQASEAKSRGSIAEARTAIAGSVRARHYALLASVSAVIQVVTTIALRFGELR